MKPRTASGHPCSCDETSSLCSGPLQEVVSMAFSTFFHTYSQRSDTKLRFPIFPCPIGYGRALQTIFPPAAIPLAFLRSPYLNRWQFATNGSTIGRVRPATSTCQSNSLARCRNLIVTYILEYQHACHCLRPTCFLGHADTVIL